MGKFFGSDLADDPLPVILGGADCVVAIVPVGVIVAPGSSDDVDDDGDDDDVSEGSLESPVVLSGSLSDELPDEAEVGAGLSEPLVEPGVAGGGVGAEAELVAGLFEAEPPVCEGLPVFAGALEVSSVSGNWGRFCASDVEIKRKDERKKR